MLCVPVLAVMVLVVDVKMLLELDPILPVPEVKEMFPPEIVPLPVSVMLPEPLAMRVALVVPVMLLAPIAMMPLLAVVCRVRVGAVTLPARVMLLLSRNWKVVPAEEVPREAAPTLVI